MNAMAKTMRCLGMALAALAWGLSHAEDAAWNKSAAGTSYDWTHVVNWLPDTTFPDGAGQTAFVTNDIIGGQIIRLRKHITLGMLATGDGVAVGNDFALTIGNASGEAYGLTFDSGVEGFPARIVLEKTGTATSYLSVPMTLASDLLVDLTGTDASNRQNLTLNGALAMNGHRIVFTNGVYTQGQVTFGTGSEFTGTGEILNNARSTLSVDGKKAFSGRLVANGKATGSNTSTFNFTNGGFTNAMEVVVNGFVTNSNVREGGGLNSGNGSLIENNPGQRFTRNRITMNGGYLVANGQAAKVGTTNDWLKGLEWVRDEVAVLDFKSGFNYVAVNKGGNTLGTVFAVGTLLRARGVSVYLFNATGTDKRFEAANGADYLVGAGGPAGSPAMSVVPWMGVYGGGGFVNPLGFATFEASTGFRVLDTTSEYTNSITAGASYNVSGNTVALAADTTINALRFTGGSSNIGTGKTLTLASGGLFFNGSGTLGASGNGAAGTLAFGAAEAVVSVHALNSAVIGAVITGTEGFSKIQSGRLTLTGANAYTGPTHVGGGTLRVGDGTYASHLGNGDVEVHAGAKLWVSCAEAVADTATVRLHNTGPDFYFGCVELDAGTAEAVRFLFLGTVGMPSGTYGSSASAADHKDDRYFAGTGVLTVTGNANMINSGTVISVL